MCQLVNVLIIEDREHDAALMVRELQRGGYALSCERVDNEAATIDALARRMWDIVLADYSLPQFDAKGALGVIAKLLPDVPCIVVSGAVGEETAVEVMRAGAQDLILKHNLKRLAPAVGRELAAARMRLERRAADAKLDRERQLLDQLMKGIPDAICFKDLARRYIRLNDAECMILNVADDAGAIGKTSDTFLSAELAQKRRAEEEQVLRTGEPLVDCIEEIAAPDGTVRWISSTKAPIRGNDNEIVGIVEIARDITASKVQEQMKNEFVATVSHELRTPLTSIMGSIGLLAGASTHGLPESAMRMLNIALSNCKRLVSIVNDILDIEKIESGKIHFERRPVEMLALVDQVVQANQGMAASHSVRVRLDDASVPAMVFSDPDRMTQVIANLLSNAIKFSAQNEEVVLKVEHNDAAVRVSVRDHGPGIPEDYKDRIFDKFVQVDASDQRQRGGTGLGLSIVKEILSRLDGKISFEAAPGRGTIFVVELPRYDQETPDCLDRELL